ncbi:MAG: hypothetical protein U9R68_03435 [Planctomycetota bacterium]|nr:hypothetical protein [Planctomycetota bacterium]
MRKSETHARRRCALPLNRRHFLTAAGAAAAAVQFDLLDFASSLFAAEPKPEGKPRVGVVYLRPPKPMVVSWPGGNCDVDAQQALFTKTLREAAAKLDVHLNVCEKPLWTKEEVGGYLDRILKNPPDGLIVGAMCLFGWNPVNRVIEHRGDVPTIVYSNMSGFTGHLQCGRDVPKTFLGATQDVGWLEQALRMLNTMWRMRHTRILDVSGHKDGTVEPLGTEFHCIPKRMFHEEFEKAKETDEVRAIADFYEKTAKKIVEPTKEDILNAARNYVVCRRLMEAENCHGITIDCLGWKNPVCLAFLKLRDEGIVAACEADRWAALSSRLTHLLCDRPGFQQDPSPNTINNTLIGAHCTSPTKLEGFDKPYRAPFVLRDYHTQTGVSPQVLWPVGRDVTVMEFAGPQRIILGTGRVRANIPQPPSGCCRTAVEVELDGVTDSLGRVDARDTKGFHQLFILGNLGRMFRAYGKLAGIKVEPICT